MCSSNSSINKKQYFMDNREYFFHGISYTCPFNNDFMNKQFQDRLIMVFHSYELKKFVMKKYTIDIDIEKFEELKGKKLLKFEKPFVEYGILGNFYTYLCTAKSDNKNIVEFDISISIDGEVTFSILFFRLVNGKFEIEKKVVNNFFTIENENDLLNIVGDIIFNEEYSSYWKIVQHNPQ
ncbi:MAG: hypothetical protein KA059_09300 [Elusimicrobiales bacterium]|nr:hypothetical protein [Elusimicrobiales bacterium]